jgi:hypothetical protein
MVMSRCKALNMSRSDYHFSRREIREYTNWGNTQLKVHLQRLEDLEYLIIHRGGRGQSIVYELTYGGEGNEGTPFMMGLIELEHLKQSYDEKKSGVMKEKSGSSRPQISPKSGGGRAGKNGCKPSNGKAFKVIEEDKPEKGLIQVKSSGASCRNRKPKPSSTVATQGQR